MFLKGERIGKYEIVDAIGNGGFGAVYLAIDTWLQQKVALKVPHQQSEEFFNLVKEARLQASLNHKNIVRLLTVEKIDSVFFMVMEYIDGETLESIIKRKGKLPLYKALIYFEQILEGVNFAHKKNILHRDLRSSNIMVDRDDTIKITDFGTSRILQTQQYASTKIGTPPYMAPEQFDGKATFASDIYSIGCIFYEMITGAPPILDNNPYKIKEKALRREVKPLNSLSNEISIELNRIIMKMIEPQIEKRYKDVSEVLYNLKVYLNDDDKRDYLNKIRDRIKESEKKEEKTYCWNCKREIPPFSKVCPFCGVEQ